MPEAVEHGPPQSPSPSSGSARTIWRRGPQRCRRPHGNSGIGASRPSPDASRRGRGPQPHQLRMHRHPTFRCDRLQARALGAGPDMDDGYAVHRLYVRDANWQTSFKRMPVHNPTTAPEAPRLGWFGPGLSYPFPSSWQPTYSAWRTPSATLQGERAPLLAVAGGGGATSPCWRSTRRRGSAQPALPARRTITALRKSMAFPPTSGHPFDALAFRLLCRLPRRQFGPSLAALAGRPEAPPARRGRPPGPPPRPPFSPR